MIKATKKKVTKKSIRERVKSEIAKIPVTTILHTWESTTPPDTMDVYLGDDVQKVYDILTKDLQLQKELKKNQKVFVEPYVPVPRDTFKRKYPDNPIVRNAGKADITICSSIRALRNISHSEITLCEISPGHYVTKDDIEYDRAIKALVPAGAKEVLVMECGDKFHFNVQLNDVIDDLYDDLNDERKRIMYKDLKLSGNKVMDDTAFSKVQSMLCSSDKELRKMGATVLEAYDYNLPANREYLAGIIMSCNGRFHRYIEFVNHILRDHITIPGSYNEVGRNRFWSELAVKMPESMGIQNVVSNIFRKKLGIDYDVKIGRV